MATITSTLSPASRIRASLVRQPQTQNVSSASAEDTSTDHHHHHHHSSIAPQIVRLHPPNPVPAPLHTCREARDYLTSSTATPPQDGHYRYQYYQQAFSQLPGNYLRLGFEAEPQPLRRYTWVDFDVDMISLGETYMEICEAHYLDIRRLKFARDRYALIGGDSTSTSSGHEFFSRCEADFIEGFTRVEEVHVVCLGPRGLADWEDIHAEKRFP
ncbi:hypothetical protein SMACR_09040 [Sordaria macrospora]|uniref:WGS project CABT00000000 data, contig 2.62 n=2 Tax=Sordaria macrospora TaxID=5147 RepID=F7WAJ0_SORMK|nr:uncharacterized protein SMAC_09040 [Sordaria macrospora k-hell]KAA8628802.1 hypothetical protein SMACR_09040 [Sordaria macrospora]WPJ62590.1 hypothetical protein SMAC4_09040 [Sordaria macrospora]CCC14184.1 unnamed protein product [Sordaria macrospora k-hell]